MTTGTEATISLTATAEPKMDRAKARGTEWLATDDSWRALQPPAWDELAGAGIGDNHPHRPAHG